MILDKGTRGGRASPAVVEEKKYDRFEKPSPTTLMRENREGTMSRLTTEGIDVRGDRRKSFLRLMSASRSTHTSTCWGG